MSGTADLMIYSILLLSLVLVIMLTRRESGSFFRTLFIAIVVSTLILLCTDLISSLLDGKAGMVYRRINIVSNFILHAFTTLPFAFWYAYFEFHITGDGAKIKASLINKIPVIISIILVIWNQFSGKLYYIDVNNHRIIEPGIITLYSLNVIYFVLSFIKYFRSMRIIDRKTKLAFISFTLFPMVSAAIQLFNPELLIIWSGTSVGILFFFYFLEIQDLYTDYLTGLPNRRKGDDVLEKEIRKAGRKFSLIIIDLDDFKGINDNFGHPEGDSGLKIFSNILKVSVKSDDFIYRFAGDEFIIITACEDDKCIKMIIKRLRENTELFNSKGIKPYKIMFSAGYTVFDPVFHPNSRELLRVADCKMYNEKKNRHLDLRNKVLE